MKIKITSFTGALRPRIEKRGFLILGWLKTSQLKASRAFQFAGGRKATLNLIRYIKLRGPAG